MFGVTFQDHGLAKACKSALFLRVVSWSKIGHARDIYLNSVSLDSDLDTQCDRCLSIVEHRQPYRIHFGGLCDDNATPVTRAAKGQIDIYSVAIVLLTSNAVYYELGQPYSRAGNGPLAGIISTLTINNS